MPTTEIHTATGSRLSLWIGVSLLLHIATIAMLRPTEAISLRTTTIEAELTHDASAAPAGETSISQSKPTPQTISAKHATINPGSPAHARRTPQHMDGTARIVRPATPKFDEISARNETSTPTTANGVSQAKSVEAAPEAQERTATRMAPLTEPPLATRQALLTYLRREIERRKSYPAVARRKGWQGDVTVALTVKPNGLFDEVHIEQSSGFPTLDHAAQRLLADIRAIPPDFVSIDSQPIDLAIAVSYQLN